MNKKIKKQLSILLCIIMVCGIMPFALFSAGAEDVSYKKGDTVTFGKYEQDDNTENGAEDISWKVLDVQEDKILIISKNILASKPYNSTYAAVTWETCSLRSWLNDDFYNAAFSDEEKAKIKSVEIVNSKNPSYNVGGGNNTTDKVFLLSYNEAVNYFSSYDDRACNSTIWWLRTPGMYNQMTCVVQSSGNITPSGMYVDTSRGVRPVMYLNIKNTITLVANDGTGETEKQYCTDGNTFYPECPFTNKGYTFIGWYLDEECTQKWTENDTVDDDMTIYARWKANAPQLQINSYNEWEVSYDNGTTWESLGVTATGADGQTPFIGSDGNWWIGSVNTGVKAQGNTGADGADGVGIASIVKTDTNDNVDTYTITLTNSITYTFTVTNGTDGKDGKDGTDGKDAVAITGIHYNENGELIVEMSDGTSYNAGKPAEQQTEDDNEATSFLQKIIDLLEKIFEILKKWFK